MLGMENGHSHVMDGKPLQTEVAGSRGDIASHEPHQGNTYTPHIHTRTGQQILLDKWQVRTVSYLAQTGLISSQPSEPVRCNTVQQSHSHSKRAIPSHLISRSSLHKHPQSNAIPRSWRINPAPSFSVITDPNSNHRPPPYRQDYMRSPQPNRNRC